MSIITKNEYKTRIRIYYVKDTEFHPMRFAPRPMSELVKKTIMTGEICLKG